MTPTLAVVIALMGIAIGWIGRGLRLRWQKPKPIKFPLRPIGDAEWTGFISGVLSRELDGQHELAGQPKIRTWATVSTDPIGTRKPHVFVQWKGTDVCLDFFCDCGGGGHYDGDFAYGLRCSDCGTEWLMPHTFGLLPDADGAIQDTDLPHRERPTTDVRFAEVVDEDDDAQAPPLPASVETPEGRAWLEQMNRGWREAGQVDDRG